MAASLLAREGSSWTSMKTASTPAATPADASGSMYSASPAVTPSPAPGQLQAVRHVEDDGVAELAQHRKGTHVDDQVVVAEADAAFRHQHRCITFTGDLLQTCRMSRGARNCPFLTLTAFPVRAAATSRSV